jgi:hypothetical protein
MGKLMGLLGLWLSFHGVEPPLPPTPPLRFACFGWPHGGRADMLGGFIDDMPVHADGVSFTQCYARTS